MSVMQRTLRPCPATDRALKPGVWGSLPAWVGEVDALCYAVSEPQRVDDTRWYVAAATSIKLCFEADVDIYISAGDNASASMAGTVLEECIAHVEHTRLRLATLPEVQTELCERRDKERSTAGERATSPEPVAVYSYRDEQGRVVFEVLRYAPKAFRQRSPNGKGGWRWGRTGVDPVLYRLPEVLAAVAGDRIIFVVEGERDADRLVSLGLEATTNPGGAGKWETWYAKDFTGGHPTVAVIADNDEPGRKHAARVAATLRGRGVHVVVLELPGLPAKGDVSDWLDAGGTVEELVRLAEGPWT